MVSEAVGNPFDAIAEESAGYDMFLNANMLEKVEPRARISIFICHFPEKLRGPDFAVDHYTFIIASSNYGARWIKKRWALTPTCVLYPPVDIAGPPTEKENLILSVTRFEIGGSKKQKELIRAFNGLVGYRPDLLDGWRLLLIGGSLPNNRYLEEVRELAQTLDGRIEVRVNVPATELQSVYAKAKIFWHACGLNETDPRLIEHFGMTTVEAMQNYCAPVVINGGGQRECVEHGRSGFLFNTIDELCGYTLRLIGDAKLLRRLQEGAYEASQRFRRARFEEKVKQFFNGIREEYSTVRLPDPKDVAENSQGRSSGLRKLFGR
jgi:glycosyltransferase involved in cell wall biosynthesis